MDERQPKRSLADDPNFLASLSDLDRGLSDDDRDAAASPIQPSVPRLVPRAAPAPIAAPRAATPITVAAPPPPLAAQSAPTPSAVGLPEPPAWLPPTAFAAIKTASAALATAFDSAPVAAPPSSAAPPAPAGGAGAPRTLLDLFPPAATRESTAPSLPLRESVAPPPPIAAVEPPRVAVRPRTFPAPTPARASYETFYGLDEKPFAAAADLRFLYHGTAHDRALQDLVSSVGRHDAVAVLTAPDGMGKTMLCRALADQLDRRTLVSQVAVPPTSPEHLLSTLLVDFGVVSQADMDADRLASASRLDLSRALKDFLGSLAVLPASALLIVDDAHRLPSAVLHEIRTLADVAASEKLVQIILVGEPSLTRYLKSEFKAIDDGVALRAELGPLEADEVPGYVAHRLAVSGRGERVGFSEVALRKIFTLSRGVPGVINQICDRALTLGYQSSASNIDGDFVEDAAQQLGLVGAEAGESWRDRMMIALLMIALMLAGAGIAGWVFREPLSRVVTQWHGGGPSTSSTPR